MSQSLLTVAPSPHIHTELTIPQVMRGVIIAMVPALLVSVYNFGLGAVYVTGLSILFCAGAEWAICKFLLKREPTITDGSAVITGMLLAFNVPSNLPWYIILIGSLVSVGIGKMS
ncbi:MAG: RnfABCDGE type electron transport complex subunit D, partial [Cyclobacteriaceae bacterium]